MTMQTFELNVTRSSLLHRQNTAIAIVCNDPNCRKVSNVEKKRPRPWRVCRVLTEEVDQYSLLPGLSSLVDKAFQ